jgi:hypothetical protein
MGKFRRHRVVTRRNEPIDQMVHPVESLSLEEISVENSNRPLS